MSDSPRIRSTKSIAFREIVLLAIGSFRLNQIRFALTALGMVIGTASLILVVTIGLSGRRYVLTSIQNIGTNLIWAPWSRRYLVFRRRRRWSTCPRTSPAAGARNAMS